MSKSGEGKGSKGPGKSGRKGSGRKKKSAAKSEKTGGKGARASTKGAPKHSRKSKAKDKGKKGRGQKGQGSGGGQKGGGGSGRGFQGGRSGKRGESRAPAMDEMTARIVSALADSDSGPLKTADLARVLEIPPQDQDDFHQKLQDLERKGTLYRVTGERYAVASKLDLVTGSISLTRNGDGFIRADDGSEDVFVPGVRLATAMDGDRVVTRIERRPKGRSREGTVIRVLERARDKVVGTFHEGRRVAYVTPVDIRLNQDVLIARGDRGGAQDGQIVVVRIVSYGEGRVGPTGTVEEVLGAPDDPGVDVLSVAHGFGVSLDFPPHVDEAGRIAAQTHAADGGPDRTDRTDLLCFTIDPSDAKDHDDALSAVPLPDGNVEVGIHIADVSHFVRPNTPVDVEAVERGTSVYLVDRTVPMLPEALSNDVCSLHAGAPKFAVSLFVELDGNARIVSRRYERTTLTLAPGLSYEDAQEVLDGTGSVSPEVDEALRRLDDLARHIRATRRGRGSLDFDLPEAKVILNERGAPVDIRRRERLSSHRLVEDYMILANEVVANDMEAADVPVMYRVHEPPSVEKAEALAETVARFGLKVKVRKSMMPSDMQEILEAVKGKEEEALVSTVVLRSLKKARYYTENLGHFGLASPGYLHFTSPIRRYPDLVVHRVLTDVLVHGNPPPYRDVDALTESAEHCSLREQAAAEAERASVAMKKVEFMERHLGEEFSGRISGVAAFGFFVTLDDFFVEGLVHVSGLQDDYYHFDERTYTLVGERRGRRFRLGDPVDVLVARVDKEARQIDFAPVGGR